MKGVDVKTHPFTPDPELHGLYCRCGLPKNNRRHEGEVKPQGEQEPLWPRQH